MGYRILSIVAEPRGRGTVHLLPLSASTEGGLEEATDHLVAHLEGNPDRDLAELAEVLQTERPALGHRRLVVAGQAALAARYLRERDPKRVFTGRSAPHRPIVFMVAGVGDHYPGLAAGLYRRLPAYRQELDRCFRLLEPEVGTDLGRVIYPQGALTRRTPARQRPDLAAAFEAPGPPDEIQQTLVAQPLAFAMQYAMARLLQTLGVDASVLLGYSVGEYVAACLAGVFPVESALRVVANRARLVASLPEGTMLAVASELKTLEPYLHGRPVSVAAVDGPELTVVSGPTEAVVELRDQLFGAGIACQHLPVSHAFHSVVMEPAVAPLQQLLSTVPLRPPRVPLLSNVTGTWMRAEDATSPEYWARHVRCTVRFADDVAEIWQLADPILVELGPGQTLSRMAMQSPARMSGEPELVLPTLPGTFERQSDLSVFLGTIGQLWVTGSDIRFSELRYA